MEFRFLRPSTKGLMIVLSLFCVLSCSTQSNTANEEAASTTSASQVSDDALLNSLQGTWVSDEDTLSSVVVSGSEWNFQYSGTQSDESDRYTIALADTMAPFVDATVQGDFLILSNSVDTMRYQIEGLNEETLSLTYFPGMNTLVYKKKQ